jgi:RHS repeat-associated protein
VIEDRYFIYDGWNVIEETIAPATGPVETAEHVWGTDLSGTAQGAGGVGGLLLRESSATGASYYHYDGNGNVTALTSAAGVVQAAYTYGAFGETLRAAGPLAQANPWRFSTKYQDDETGLLYYGYRFYNPTDGRWPSRDPIEERGGINLYGFVDNDGLDFFDVLGLYFADGASRFGINTNGVKLDRKGDIALDIKDSGTSLVPIVTQHEQMHKDKIKKSKYWNALPYKQVFKVYARDPKTGLPLKDASGKVICQGWGYLKNTGTSENGNYVLIMLNETKETELWGKEGAEPGIWNHTSHESYQDEKEAWTWEIAELRKHKRNASFAERANTLETGGKFLPGAIVGLKQPNVENPNWIKFKQKIEQYQAWYEQNQLKWEWRTPAHIYTELNK